MARFPGCSLFRSKQDATRLCDQPPLRWRRKLLTSRSSILGLRILSRPPQPNTGRIIAGRDQWILSCPAAVGWQPSRMRRIAGTAQPRPPGGHARAPRVVVDGGGRRWPYPLPCARQRFTFCLATCRLSLSLAVGVRVASTWVDRPRRWREGQGHDGWNREMVQRRQGLRLHRP
jgi:hypothetical protein